jgi:hypothetical protein
MDSQISITATFLAPLYGSLHKKLLSKAEGRKGKIGD